MDDPAAAPQHASLPGVVYLTRGVSSAFASALTSSDAPALDPARASEDHAAFVALLEARGRPVGGEVVEVAADANQPDCVFVEDCVVFTPGRGIFACAPHDDRAGEVRAVVDAALSATEARWKGFPGVAFLAGAADAAEGERVEGGDVMYVRGGDDTRHHYFVGVGNRSNAKGAEALRRALRVAAERSLADGKRQKFWGTDADPDDFDRAFKVHEIDLSDAKEDWLHLKSAITWAPYVGFVASDAACPVYRRVAKALENAEATAVNKIDKPCVVVPRRAANALWLPGNVVIAHPDAVGAVRERGGNALDAAVACEQPELAKADGALTCGVVVMDPFFDWGGFS